MVNQYQNLLLDYFLIKIFIEVNFVNPMENYYSSVEVDTSAVR
jgi:hypothetical protein